VAGFPCPGVEVDVGVPVGVPVGVTIGVPIGVAVGLPVGLPVGAPVGAPVGLLVGIVRIPGVTGAFVTGVTRVVVGTWLGSCVGDFSDGPTVSGEVVDSPAETGVVVTTGRGSERRSGAAAGSGTSGVFTVGPPSRLLTSSTTYAVAGTARNAPARRIVRWRRPVESTKTGFRPEIDFTSAGSYTGSSS
jgi:hypothetical protein